MTVIVIPDADRARLVRHEAYLVLVDLGGHRYFGIVVYKGGGKFAQDDGPDVDIEHVVSVFRKPRESYIRTTF